MKLVMGGDDMVDINQLPDEGIRLKLEDLPDECELIALGENYKEGSSGVAAGLVIEFEMHDGAKFHQKYTAVSGAVLKKAFKKLKIKNTEALQKDWYNYRKTAMRMGLPRMIPIKKVI